jgi:hypothetical protein
MVPEECCGWKEFVSYLSAPNLLLMAQAVQVLLGLIAADLVLQGIDALLAL